MIKFSTSDNLVKTAHRLGLDGFFVYSDTDSQRYMGVLDNTVDGWKVDDVSVHEISYPVFLVRNPL